MEKRQSTVYSTLSRVLMGNGLLRDASISTILQQKYVSRKANFSSSVLYTENEKLG